MHSTISRTVATSIAKCITALRAQALYNTLDWRARARYAEPHPLAFFYMRISVIVQLFREVFLKRGQRTGFGEPVVVIVLLVFGGPMV